MAGFTSNWVTGPTRGSMVYILLRKRQLAGIWRAGVSNNPFDDDSGTFYVLVNGEEQHSLWPTFADVPAGWYMAYGEADRASCLDYIEQNWPDIRPKTLRERLVAGGASDR